MKFMFRGVFLAFLAIVLFACNEIKVEDGRVPAEYLEVAKQLEGAYLGEFEDQEGQLTIRFDGDRPIVEFHSNAGDDLLGTPCQSSINLLTAFKGKKKKEKVTIDYAIFDFNPNQCRLWVEGRALYLDFKALKDGRFRVKASILKETRSFRECYWDPNRRTETCNERYEYDWLRGKFYR